MKRNLFGIILLSATCMMAGCGNTQTEEKQTDPSGSQSEMTTTDEPLELTLAKMPLTRSKEVLLAAWKKIPVTEQKGEKSLSYKDNTPLYFISADLDGDGTAEVLLRGEEPYAAIYSCKDDSLYFLTCVENDRMGLGITPEGSIVRSMNDKSGNAVTEFLTLRESLVAGTGRCTEIFEIQGKTVASGGMRYELLKDSVMQEVSREEFQQAAPALSVTFFDALEGWEDFRKP